MKVEVVIVPLSLSSHSPKFFLPNAKLAKAELVDGKDFHEIGNEIMSSQLGISNNSEENWTTLFPCSFTMNKSKDSLFLVYGFIISESDLRNGVWKTVGDIKKDDKLDKDIEQVIIHMSYGALRNV